MKRYYAVGQAIQTVESASIPEGIYYYGFRQAGLGLRRPRELTQKIIKDEAFPSGKISLIFSDYEEAKKYSVALCGEVLDWDDRTWRFESGAPVLTFETDKLDHTHSKEQDIKNILNTEFPYEYIRNDELYYIWKFKDYTVIEKALETPLKLSVISDKLDLNEVNIIKADFPTILRMQPVEFQLNNSRSKCSVM